MNNEHEHNNTVDSIIVGIVSSLTSEVRDSCACCAEAAEASSSRARMVEAEARSRGVSFMALVRLLSVPMVPNPHQPVCESLMSSSAPRLPCLDICTPVTSHQSSEYRSGSGVSP